MAIPDSIVEWSKLPIYDEESFVDERCERDPKIKEGPSSSSNNTNLMQLQEVLKFHNLTNYNIINSPIKSQHSNSIVYLIEEQRKNIGLNIMHENNLESWIVV